MSQFLLSQDFEFRTKYPETTSNGFTIDPFYFQQLYLSNKKIDEAEILCEEKCFELIHC